MKKTITTMTLLIGIVAVLFAQSAPEVVKSAFNKKFPTATSVIWEKENSKEWEAEFKLDGKEYSANFSNDGTWKETEHEIALSDLPSSVQKTLKSEFAEYEIKEVEMVENSGFTGYEIEVKKGKETLELVLDQNGKVLKKKVEEEEED
ncbi:MAG: PepSY-like domain-containing protein [Flavobacteriales bacterium]|nr:PepSY-like domain-containing protein [Flavobacteriales bacterium]